MEFKTRKKDSMLRNLGEGVGFAASLCIFLTVLYLVTLKWGIHSVPASSLPQLYAGLIALGAAAAIAATAEKQLTAGGKKDLLEGLKEGLKGFGKYIAGGVNYILLSILYFTGVGIVSVALKASGKKFLDLRYKEDKTYYATIERGGGKAEDYLRQF